MLFYLLLPFWSILVEHMTRRQHLALTGLLLTVYTALGSIPGFGLTFNYTMWFGVVFLIASYIRLYPSPLFDDVRLWRRISLAAIALAMASVAVSHYLLGHGEYTLVREPNCIFPIAVAVATFLWFKNIHLAYSKSINAVAATTFGVYLIHDNSSAMEQWLWCDTVDAASRFALPLWQFVLFSLLTVLAVFCVCSAIERLRELAIEAPLFTLMSKV
jgi:peptidoglycan/LPS O-acetylase OafA/YrhL